MNRTAAQPPAVNCGTVAKNPSQAAGKGKEGDRGDHRRGAHGERRIAADVGTVIDATDGAREGAGEDHPFADPGVVVGSGGDKLVGQRQGDAGDGEDDAADLGSAQAFLAKGRGEDHGHQGQGREDEGAARRPDVEKAVVEQRHQDGELGDAEEANGGDVAAPKADAARPHGDRYQAGRADRVAQESEGGGIGLVDDETGRHHGCPDQDGGDDGGGNDQGSVHGVTRANPYGTPARDRSQVSPTRSWPKLWWGSSRVMVKSMRR